MNIPRLFLCFAVCLCWTAADAGELTEAQRARLGNHTRWLSHQAGAGKLVVHDDAFAGADLRRMDLRVADFRWANLQGTDFSETDCQGCDFRWADVRKAVFLSTNLKYTQRDGIRHWGEMSAEVSPACTPLSVEER